LLFTREKASNVKQADLREMLEKAFKNVCVSIFVVSLDPLSINPSNSSAMKTPENTEEDLADPEPAGGDVQMEYSSD
jgi:hypothetical protein